ncbi:MAG TPA: type IV pilus twitching motility protein PilT [Thermodesulfobacteriota bacterium]|nr:type IV pilus twitching motility protein PilT [Thermodesulfobacteriota bacterium]
MAEIDKFFNYMVENNISDLHISSGSRPLFRQFGELKPASDQILTHDVVKKLLYEILNEEQTQVFNERNDLDFAHELTGLARFRVNYFMQQRGMSGAFRLIPTTVESLDTLGFPEILKSFSALSRGLVLVTGPTGCGKSTTLAAIVDHINKTRTDHIVTIEDPIEFVHTSDKCLIHHRQVGIHTKSFSGALRASLREDPDIIMLGEMRDLETIELAITAAETGHLVFATLHTSSAPKTIDRVIDAFPAGQQAQIRTMLSESLKGIVCQQLLKRTDKPGRVAALEILVVNTAISNLIREGKIFQIPSVIQTGKQLGMQMLDAAIMKYYKDGVISAEEAFYKSNDKQQFEKFIKE